MRYRGFLTIPAGTAEADPATSTLELAHGEISEVEIHFPAGHAGLTYLTIYYHEQQIYPINPDQSFRGDDQVIEMGDRFPITEKPYEVELRGWSPSATLEHTIYVGITVLPRETTVIEVSRRVALPEGL